jgi:hypothetical protein
MVINILTGQSIKDFREDVHNCFINGIGNKLISDSLERSIIIRLNIF